MAGRPLRRARKERARRAVRNPALASDLTHDVLADLQDLAEIRLRTDSRPLTEYDLVILKKVSPAQVYLDWAIAKGATRLPDFPDDLYKNSNPSDRFYRWVVVEAIQELRAVWAAHPRPNNRYLPAIDAAERWVRNPTQENADIAYKAHADIFKAPSIPHREIGDANSASATAYLAATAFEENKSAFTRGLIQSEFENFIPLRALLLLDSVGLLPEPVL